MWLFCRPTQSFGWYILKYIRYCYKLKKPNIVCIQEGHECLFPNANGFFYQWSNPIPDEFRWGDHGNVRAARESDKQLRIELKNLYPNHQIIRPSYEDVNIWDDIFDTKFIPTVEKTLPDIDIAIATRKRKNGAERNWGYHNWNWLVQSLRASGLRVGLVGDHWTSETNIVADAYAWRHLDGCLAGSVQMLNCCRLFIGTDSGLSHLAAMADVPTIFFHLDFGGLTPFIHRANKNFIKQLDCWNNRELLLKEITQQLAATGLFPKSKI